jgi:hypothetical protein
MWTALTVFFCSDAVCFLRCWNRMTFRFRRALTLRDPQESLAGHQPVVTPCRVLLSRGQGYPLSAFSWWIDSFQNLRVVNIRRFGGWLTIKKLTLLYGRKSFSHFYLLNASLGLACANGCPVHAESRDVIVLRTYATKGNMSFLKRQVKFGSMAG